MRITNSMISSSVLADLNRSLETFVNTQGQMSTGRRINKPSDDPIGTYKDLRYRNSITAIGQYRRNISNGTNLLGTYDNILGDIKNMIQSANELAVGQSNSANNDPVANGVAADEVVSIREQIIDMINSEMSGNYIFSGHRTDTLSVRVGANGYRYDGDEGVTRLKIDSSTAMAVNLTASQVLFQPLSVLGENADLELGVVPSTLLADLNGGQGIDLVNGTTPGTFVITDNNLDPPANTLTLDISTALNVNDAIAQINNQLAIGGFTNVTVGLGAEGNNLRWIVSDSGQISDSTKLENLNSGLGVDMSTGQIRFHTADDSIDVYLDVSSAETVGDIRNLINNDADLQAAGIMATINLAETGLQILDTDWPATELIVEDVEGSQTAQNLGLSGAAGPILFGEDLDPVSDFTVTENESTQTTTTDLGLLGSFNHDFAGAELDPLLRLDSLLGNMNNGNGIDQGILKISQGIRTVEIDFSYATTLQDALDLINGSGLDIQASINAAQTGIQIEPTIDTESLTVQEVSGGDTAHDWGIYGSPDILGSLIILEEAIRNGEELDTSNLIQNTYDGMDKVLSYRSAVGSKVIRLESANSRLIDQDYNYTKLLSEVEDADLTQLVTDLAAQENSYQSALIAASKIIQPSLVNFLT